MQIGKLVRLGTNELFVASAIGLLSRGGTHDQELGLFEELAILGGELDLTLVGVMVDEDLRIGVVEDVRDLGALEAIAHLHGDRAQARHGLLGDHVLGAVREHESHAIATGYAERGEAAA